MSLTDYYKARKTASSGRQLQEVTSRVDGKRKMNDELFNLGLK